MGLDKQHRINGWVGEGAGVGTEGALEHAQYAFLVDQNRSPGNGLGRRVGESFYNLKRVGDARCGTRPDGHRLPQKEKKSI